MNFKHKGLTVNHHLLKENPLYTDKRGKVVKLLKVLKTNKGLCFTTEIMKGDSKGFWSQAYKNELKIYND